MSSSPARSVDADQPTEIAIAVVEHDGRFLIGQRPLGVPLAGLWEFPGGKVRRGETARVAAMRECREETGLSIEVVSDYPPHIHAYVHGTLRLNFFCCQPATPAVKPRPPFRWVQREELPQYAFPPANQFILRHLMRTGHEAQ